MEAEAEEECVLLIEHILRLVVQQDAVLLQELKFQYQIIQLLSVE